MAKKKTSAEMAREQSEIAKVEGMLGDAFGGVGGLEQPTQETVMPEDSPPEQGVRETDNTAPEQADSQESNEQSEPSNQGEMPETEVASVTVDGPDESAESDIESTTKPPSSPPSKPPTGPPSGPPSKPPTGPPSNPPTGPPPSVTNADAKPKAPSSPPSKPPTGPPTGPPSKPPSGPPSGPPSKPPSKPPTEEKDNLREDTAPQDNETEEVDLQVEAVVDTEEITTEADDENEGNTPDDTSEEMLEDQSKSETVLDNLIESDDTEPVDLPEPPEAHQTPIEGVEDAEDIIAKEAEIARLSAEVERLRSSMTGAADIIEELENPPMPPIVHEDLIIGAHIVADMARMARQLDRDKLVRASMGTIAMLHPDRLDVLISTKNKALLPRMNEQDLCAGKLNSDPPRGAPTDWRVLEVLLASTSIVTGGPAAVIHCHGPYSTAVSCEKDLVLMQPIDNLGKDNIGKVIIVDPDDENPREYLRQVAEALNQGGMRCVVIRGNGAYAVGADLDQAWSNAAMLEHSMKIVMLARQANLKI